MHIFYPHNTCSHCERLFTVRNSAAASRSTGEIKLNVHHGGTEKDNTIVLQEMIFRIYYDISGPIYCLKTGERVWS